MPLRSERDHASLVRVDPNPLLLLLLDDEAGTAANFDHGFAEKSHARRVRNSPPVLEQNVAVTGAIRTAPVTHLFKNKREGRVGETSCVSVSCAILEHQ